VLSEKKENHMTTNTNTTQLATDLDEAKAQVLAHQTAITECQTQITEHETALTGAQNKVKELTKELCKQLGVPYTAPKTKTTGSGKTRTFTAQARQNIIDGQKRRWENARKNKTQETTQQQETQEGSATVAAAGNTNATN
jgi:hypothetical protein